MVGGGGSHSIKAPGFLFRPQGTPAVPGPGWGKGHRQQVVDLLVFLQNVVVLVRAGVDVLDAVDVRQQLREELDGVGTQRPVQN